MSGIETRKTGPLFSVDWLKRGPFFCYFARNAFTALISSTTYADISAYPIMTESTGTYPGIVPESVDIAAKYMGMMGSIMLLEKNIFKGLLLGSGCSGEFMGH
ncbi:hypothetical protein B0H99_10270 [Planomicrobium soli]|uniref:Uncharacterized protein n=1 Tax=Planomicrobium soli TaxID=1176648 RepID=A0A2P8H586_9BACL|nr:hypothetical protein B0H99_10270 [Planomicrobium soli]